MKKTRGRRRWLDTTNSRSARVILRVTPGSVIHREDAFELIHDAPQTDEVRSVPLLSVRPMINKFYIADLAPGRSLVEYLVSQGQQVFVVSWRDPEAEHGSWGLDTYAEAILSALDVACAVAESEQAQIVAFCGGDRGACAQATWPRSTNRNGSPG